MSHVYIIELARIESNVNLKNSSLTEVCFCFYDFRIEEEV